MGQGVSTVKDKIMNLGSEESKELCHAKCEKKRTNVQIEESKQVQPKSHLPGIQQVGGGPRKKRKIKKKSRKSRKIRKSSNKKRSRK
jgi:hypothetical protein